MRNNIFISILFTTLSFAALTSCLSEVLDKGLVTYIPEEMVWTDEDLADAYLAYCYSQITFAWDANANGNHNATTGAAQVWGNICISDEASANKSQVPPMPWTMTSDIHRLAYWRYSNLRQIHLFMEKLLSPDCPLSEEFKMARSSEARFLRAFIYFNMVKRYGGIPLVTKALDIKTSTHEELYPKRAGEKEVYDFIISEMDDLTRNNLLPKHQMDRGRPSYWAALALKSRAALFAGSLARYETRFNGSAPYENGVIGIPAGEADNYFRKCYDASAEIINDGPFSLYSKFINGTKEGYIKNYRNLFLDESDNTEAIFVEIFNGYGVKGHSYDMWQVPRGANVWYSGNEASPYKDMVESYEKPDGAAWVLPTTGSTMDQCGGQGLTLNEIFGAIEPRFFASVYKQGDVWPVKGVYDTIDYRAGVYMPDEESLYVGNNVTIPGVTGEMAEGLHYTKLQASPFGLLKYLDEDGRSPADRLYSDTDYIVFRLAEIHLNLAEAAFELGTEDMKVAALNSINEIRRRAGAPDFIKERSLGELTMTLIRKERKLELAFEGGRYWDLIRWRSAKSTLTTSRYGYRFILNWNTRNDEEPRYYTFRPTQPANGAARNLIFGDHHYYLSIPKSYLTTNDNFVNNPGYGIADQ